MRWNFSSRALELSGGDALVLSIPKSGRTWLRTFVTAYFAAQTGRAFSLELTDRHDAEIPRIVYSHDRFEQRTKGNGWDRVRGKYLVPPTQTKSPILLLARDPRDAFVSYAVQLTRRNPATPEVIKQMATSELLHHPRFGIAAMVEVMNGWLREFGRRPHFSLVRYEDLRADPENLREVLRAIGQTSVDDQAFASALEFSTFENMQQLEARGAFLSKMLQPRDRNDPESFKVRRGKVGGFREYLTGEDQRYAAEVCRQLDARFGYEAD